MVTSSCGTLYYLAVTLLLWCISERNINIPHDVVQSGFAE